MGSKKDKTVDEIFAQGKIDPKLVPTGIGYVPVQPFFVGFSHPVDVLVGYDEMLYVVDDMGLHILDQAGRKQQTIAFKNASDVTQDRRLHTYVAATVDITIGGNTKNVAAVYHLINTAIGQYQIIDTLIHPFCDESRTGSGFRITDEKVRFSGLACTADNRLYVSRTGSENKDPIANPDNIILIFNSEGKYTGFTNGLNPLNPSLKSVLGISSIATFAAPPQRVFGMNPSNDIMLLQADPRNDIEFRALWVKQFNDIDLGEIFTENSSLFNFDTSKADNFLYKPRRFSNPQDIYIAPDQTNYIFIVDADNNKLHQFTNKGYEGANPSATSGLKKQQIVSFGSLGEGPLQFNQPSGVCYFKKVVYVADKNNNRICRYKLSTDLE
jgi:hypothetical protein